MTFAVVIEPLTTTHDRQGFECGAPALDRYLREQAGQDVRRRISNCFVVIEQDTGVIAAYYTLAAASIPVTSLPEAETRRLPRYPVLPATLIGRLAVNSCYQGRKLGAALIIDAVRRSARADPAVFTMLVDAKDEAAVTFYRRHGFISLTSRPATLFLPVATALKLFA
ncbi:MAG: GNAT family N-acetyltransferase [Geminicoccaceae bacterium]